MTRRDEEIALRHMLDHAREAVEMVSGHVRSDLDDSRMLELALVRLVEIVGEAAGRVREETRVRHTTIAWRQVIGMRNRLIHGYDAVDRDVLWNTVSGDLPGLIAELERILGESQ